MNAKKRIALSDVGIYDVEVLPGLKRVHFIARGPRELTQGQADAIQGQCGHAIEGYGRAMGALSEPYEGGFEIRWWCHGSCD